MDKRFLPPSFKQELYLKITYLNSENLKVEEYIREHEQLQMRVGLDEEPELKIAILMKGLSSIIASKVDLQPYLSFEEVCHLTIKVEKQLKDRMSFHTFLIKSPFTHIEVETPPYKSKLLTRVRELLVSHLKGWKERSVLSAMVLGIFEMTVPIERRLTSKR